MALAYFLTINGSIFKAPVVDTSNASALNIEAGSTLDVEPLNAEPGADIAIAAVDDSAIINSTDITSATDTDTASTDTIDPDPIGDTGSSSDSATGTYNQATRAAKATSTDQPPAVDTIDPASVETDSAVALPGASDPVVVDVEAVSAATDVGLDSDSAATSSTEIGSVEIGGAGISSVEAVTADQAETSFPLAVPTTAASDYTEELASFSLMGTLLYEQGAISSTTINDVNEQEFVLNVGNPFDATLQTGELNLVSNTALYSYFNLGTPDTDVDLVNLTTAVDPLTGMEEVSITFDATVADAADYNFFYPFLAMVPYDLTQTIEVTGGEMLLSFSSDSFLVEGSINIYGTDGTTNYLYSAELTGFAGSEYVGLAESGPPITS